MKKKIFKMLVVMLTLLLMALSTSEFNFYSMAMPGTTIYIKADGTVDPPTAPIQRDGNVYTFMGNIPYPAYYGIVVQRSNIIIDGNGYTLQGPGGDYYGFLLTSISNVMIKNTHVEDYLHGISLDSSSFNTVSGNTITNNDYGVWITGSSNNNNVSGNTITNSGWGNGGVCLYLSSSNNTVSGNTITNSSEAIWLYESSNYNRISGNTITNTNWGIDLAESCSGNTVSGNNITNSYYVGVGLLDLSSNNTVCGNLITNNGDIGVGLRRSSFNTVSGNNITNSEISVALIYSSLNNTVSDNRLMDFNGFGVGFWNASYNIISENLIIGLNGGELKGCGISLMDFSHHNIIFGHDEWGTKCIAGNEVGIELTDGAHDNTIFENMLVLNRFQVYLRNASNNRFYHDRFTAGQFHVYDESWDDPGIPPSVNTWDDGYPSGGNYWSGHTKIDEYHGPSQDQLGGDGIADTPYVIDDNNEDRYPLTLTSPYNVTIKAYCNTDATDLSVSLTKDISTETVDSSGDAGWYNSLALDSGDNPHISYRQVYDGESNLKYAYHDGTNWHIETVDGSDRIGYCTSIAVDSGDNPHISYYDAANDDLKYAYYDDGWHIQTVDSFGSVGDYNSLALDSGDNPHISYYDSTNDAIKYAFSCTTPHDFAGLKGTHLFTVPDTDPNGHPFRRWSTGEASTTITVTTDGTYTAYYQAKYTLTITTTTPGGTTNPSPGTNTYWDGTSVSVTALPDVCCLFDHWELDGDDVGSANPYSVLMDDDHTLHAVFVIGTHDVAVTNVTTSKTGCIPMPTVGEDYTAKVYVTVENQGDFTETFTVTAYANLTVIDSAIVTDLTPGSNTALTLTWDTTGFAKGNYTISAYATPVPSETDTDDNTFKNGVVKVTIAGDINGDDIVDMTDLGWIAYSYGATPSDPKWNPNADLTDDDLIDMTDLGIAAMHYGETYP